jgi:hypothetical protein
MSSIPGAMAFGLTMLVQFSAVIAMQLARSGRWYANIDSKDPAASVTKKLRSRFVDQ